MHSDRDRDSTGSSTELDFTGEDIGGEEPWAFPVRKIRGAFGLSPERLAHALDIVPEAVDQLERGRLTLPVALRERVATLHTIAELGRTVYTDAGWHAFM